MLRDRGCTRQRLGRRSQNVNISMVLATFRGPAEAALVDSSDVEAKMSISCWFYMHIAGEK